MRRNAWVLSVLVSFAFCGCGSGGSPGTSAPIPNPNANEWTWTSGSTQVNSAGIYGTQGTPSGNNTPGARAYPVSWTDTAGNFWLFGGYGSDAVTPSSGDLNDLWKFSGGEWTWVGGSKGVEQSGVYGVKGTPSAGNIPGARYQAVSWTDGSGNLWLFGGLGIDSAGTRGDLNDLWRYSAGEWTWMGGSNTTAASLPGVYGTKGVAAPGNAPGARVDANSWTDNAGNLWLFGGFGRDGGGELGTLNDLWKYSGGQWTWMSGSNAIGFIQPGVYGTQGVAAPANVPGARANAVTWADAAGNLWLFGGEGNDSTGSTGCSPCILNDLWKYSAGEWTWVGGSTVANEPGTYGTQGVGAAGNIPGARWGAVSWIDSKGTVWLFGGYGFDSTTGTYTVFGDLNDLWKYSGGQWTWVSGPTKAGQLGTYGTEGTAAQGNGPGARDSGVGWVDGSGNLWLFGGGDYLSIAYGGKFNDLWEYQP